MLRSIIYSFNNHTISVIVHSEATLLAVHIITNNTEQSTGFKPTRRDCRRHAGESISPAWHHRTRLTRHIYPLPPTEAREPLIVKLAFMIHILSYPLLLWKEQRLLLLLFPSYPIPSILPWHTKLLNIFLHYIHESYVFILFFSCLAPSSTSFVKHIHHSSSTHVQTISDLSHLFLSANHPISENSPDGIFFFFL